MRIKERFFQCPRQKINFVLKYSPNNDSCLIKAGKKTMGYTRVITITNVSKRYGSLEILELCLINNGLSLFV